MLELILFNAIAPPMLNVEAQVIEYHQQPQSLYFAKGKPYESDYSREAERERRRHELDNLQRDERYYRDGDRYRRTGDDYREERERDERRERRHRDDDRDYERDRRSRNSRELEESYRLDRLEKKLEELERRIELQFY